MLRFLLLGLLLWLGYRLLVAAPARRRIERAARRALGGDEPRGAGPHEVLGVPADASDEAIRKAYRALVKKHHPDLAPPEEREAAAARLRAVQAAYEQLGKR